MAFFISKTTQDKRAVTVMQVQPSLVDALRNAGADNEQIRAAAESQLKQWEVQPGFWSSLQDIYFNDTVESQIRWLAIIYIKNGIDKYWRKTATNAISPQEKSIIRQKLLLYTEPNKSLAVQLSQIIAKIARFDFPREWPDLLDIILARVREACTTSTPQTNMQLERSLLTLHLVVKSLASKTLPSSRRAFEELAPVVFEFLAQIFNSVADAYFANPNAQDKSEHSLTILLLSLKCLRQLILHGFGTGSVDALEKEKRGFHKHPTTSAFFTSLLHRLRSCLQLRSTFLSTIGKCPSSLDKLILLIGKFYKSILTDHPIEFVMANGSMDVCLFYWHLLESYTCVGNDVMLERFLVQGMLILRNVVKNVEFTLPPGDNDPTLVHVHQKLAQLLTKEFVTSLLSTALSKYAILSNEELETWQDDPESFVAEEDGNHFDYNVRACAYTLVMDLVSQHKETLCPMLRDLADSSTSPANLADVIGSQSLDNEGQVPQTVLFKDALYAAIGLCARDMSAFVNFDRWFQHSLVREYQLLLAHNELTTTVLRKRILQLIAQFVPVKCADETRALIYDLLSHTLASQPEDTVVLLTAVDTLRAIVEDWEFDAGSFQPHLSNIISSIVSLCSQFEEFQSRLKALNAIGSIIEKMENAILPFVEVSVTVLNKLWIESNGQHMFRSGLLGVLTKLVTAIRGHQFDVMSTIVAPIIHYTITDKEAHVHLIDDGLELWLATVTNVPKLTVELLSLFPLIIAYISQYSDTEYLIRMLRLTDAYIVLDPGTILQHHAQALFPCLSELLVQDMRPETTKLVLVLLNRICQACAAQGMMPPFEDAISTSGLVERMASAVVSKKLEKEQQAVPLFLMKVESIIVYVEYLAFFARLLVYDYAYFTQVMGNMVHVVLDIWIDKWDAISHPKTRKLVGMAVTQLLASNDEIILKSPNMLNGIFAIITSVLTECKEHGDSLVFWRDTIRDDIVSGEDNASDDANSLDAHRRVKLIESDPVTTLDFIKFFTEKIAEQKFVYGERDGETFDVYLSRVLDPQIAQCISGRLLQ